MKHLYNKILLLIILSSLLSLVSLSHAENYLSLPVTPANSEAFFDVEKLQDSNFIDSKLTINQSAIYGNDSNELDSDEVADTKFELLNDVDSFYASYFALLKLNQYFPEGLPFTPTLLNAIFFRSHIQTNPIYTYTSIQEPPVFSTSLHDESISLLDITPWFVQPIKQVKNRLSGWKDGNFLYTACITYY